MLDRLNASATEPVPLLDCDLHYVSDSEPGIRRQRCGAGFRYKAIGAGKVLPKDIERIKALAIPPAWEDVWICAHSKGHIQATGRESARTQAISLSFYMVCDAGRDEILQSC